MVIHIALFLSDIMDGCYGFDHSYKQQLDWLAIIDTIRDNEVDEDTRRWDPLGCRAGTHTGKFKHSCQCVSIEDEITISLSRVIQF